MMGFTFIVLATKDILIIDKMEIISILDRDSVFRLNSVYLNLLTETFVTQEEG